MTKKLSEDHPVHVYQRQFGHVTPETHLDLGRLYAEDVVFEDPLQRIEGFDALSKQLALLQKSLREATFIWEDVLVKEGSAALVWSVELKLRFVPGMTIRAPGVTHLRFDTHIKHQRDFWDAGPLTEKVPLLRPVLQRLYAGR